MDLKKSIFYRARSFVNKRSIDDLAKKNGLNTSLMEGVSKELIETMETIKNFQNKSNILLDIGAHKGYFSKVADSFFDLERVICFEPNKIMNASIKKNDPNNKFEIENIALANKEGETTFFLHQDDTMNSLVDPDISVQKEEFPWDDPELLKETVVKTSSLDSYIHQNGLSGQCFFIKLDTQGNELNVLKHGKETLKNTELVLVEFMFTTPYKSDFNFYDLTHFMEENNFECKGALSISKRPSKKISAVDLLFVKK